MNFCRLSALLFALTMFTAPAQAQYTSKSTGSGFTTKTKTTTAATTSTTTTSAATTAKTTQPAQKTTTAAKVNPYTGSATTTATTAKTNTYTSSKPTAAKTNSYTVSIDKKAVENAAQAVTKAASSVQFRPRTQKAATDDDDLPSFDAIEAPKGGQTAAQGSNVPPPPPPKGEIWFYVADFTTSNVRGLHTNCSWKVVVQNRTDATIDRMRLTYNFVSDGAPVALRGIAPNGSKVVEQAWYAEDCPAAAYRKPKVKVLSCKMRGLSTPAACEKYIKIK